MIEKLKSVALSIFEALSVFLGGLVVYFFNRNRQLKAELDEVNFAKAIEKTVEKQKGIDEQAEMSYRSYLRAKHDSEGGDDNLPPAS